ncbi:MAG: hypothetical protein VCC00_14695 [Deltaproteobacteria bacterium]
MDFRTLKLSFACIALLGLAFDASLVSAQELPKPFAGNCCGCNGNIKLRGAAKPDLIRVGARVFPSTAMNPFDDGFTFLLSNADGSLFSETLAPGVMKEMPNGRRWSYRNPAAPAAGGIHTVKIQQMSGPAAGFIFYVRAYADLAAATETEMTTRLIVGDDSFFDSSDWNQRKNGWRHIFW